MAGADLAESVGRANEDSTNRLCSSGWIDHSTTKSRANARVVLLRFLG